MNLIRYQTNKPSRRLIRKYQSPYSLASEFTNWLDSMSPANLFDFGHTTDYFSPRLNMKDDGNKYVVEVDVPGYDEKSLNISIDGRQLTLTGSYTEENEDNSDKYLVKEKRYSSFTRAVYLPDGADVDMVKASLQKGVLYIDVPKNVEAVSPKTVEIVNEDK